MTVGFTAKIIFAQIPTVPTNIILCTVATDIATVTPTIRIPIMAIPAQQYLITVTAGAQIIFCTTPRTMHKDIVAIGTLLTKNAEIIPRRHTTVSLSAGFTRIDFKVISRFRTTLTLERAGGATICTFYCAALLSTQKHSAGNTKTAVHAIFISIMVKTLFTKRAITYRAFLANVAAPFALITLATFDTLIANLAPTFAST